MPLALGRAWAVCRLLQVDHGVAAFLPSSQALRDGHRWVILNHQGLGNKTWEFSELGGVFCRSVLSSQVKTQAVVCIAFFFF